MQQVPNKSNWDNAYQQDLKTILILDHLSVNTPFGQTIIVNLLAACRATIARNQIAFLGGRLVYYKAISFANKHIYCITVPSSLRHKHSNLMHATPVAGHMGEYKTLYHIRLWFFWPRMRSDIKVYPDKYILWSGSIYLTDTSCYLHGPFNFETHSDIISAKQHVALIHWEYPLTICNQLSVVPVIISTLTKMKVTRKKRKKQT